MTPTAYYNDNDQFAAAWLRNLIAANLIAPGEVDERSIRDVQPDDLRGFTQCHFFAGIGVWSHALRLAGWPDERPIWTGSCPCQPFSVAGGGKGFADDRHLWPDLFRLIRECRPVTILGEQVASRDGLHWLDLVYDDLEGAGYAVGAVDTSSALHGAPHIRQRLRWMAHANDSQRWAGMAGWNNRDRSAAGWNEGDCEPREHCEVGGMHARPGPTNGFWRDVDWLFCRGGKWRPIEPGIEPLVARASSRVGRLRAYGNAVDAQATAAFIEAVMDCLP
jgi:DNA (cytosine-5)-methyltransferase 1